MEIRPLTPHELSGLYRPGSFSGSASVGLTWVPSQQSSPQSQVGTLVPVKLRPVVAGNPLIQVPEPFLSLGDHFPGEY